MTFAACIIDLKARIFYFHCGKVLACNMCFLVQLELAYYVFYYRSTMYVDSHIAYMCVYHCSFIVCVSPGNDCLKLRIQGIDGSLSLFQHLTREASQPANQPGSQPSNQSPSQPISITNYFEENANQYNRIIL